MARWLTEREQRAGYRRSWPQHLSESAASAQGNRHPAATGATSKTVCGAANSSWCLRPVQWGPLAVHSRVHQLESFPHQPTAELLFVIQPRGPRHQITKGKAAHGTRLDSFSSTMRKNEDPRGPTCAPDRPGASQWRARILDFAPKLDGIKNAWSFSFISV
jgi:hypothetical protein